MAKKCYYITYVNCANQSGSGYVCADDLAYVGGGSCGGGYFYSASNGFNEGNASEKSGSVTQVDCSSCEGCCSGEVSPNQAFDCLNGGCIPKSTYGTPGTFANLTACQYGCAKNSDCKGECVSAEELAALQQAASALQAKICG